MEKVERRKEGKMKNTYWKNKQEGRGRKGVGDEGQIFSGRKEYLLKVRKKERDGGRNEA